MVQWFMSHWQMLGMAVLGAAEIFAIFVPGAQGTVKTLIKALVSLGVKDPSIGSP